MRLLRIATGVFLCAWALFGQAGTGTITGTVIDPAGAIIAGASVEVTNTETGVVHPTVTTSTGAYTANNLPVGSYSVSVMVAGFKKFTRTGLSLAATQVLAIPIALE